MKKADFLTGSDRSPLCLSLDISKSAPFLLFLQARKRKRGIFSQSNNCINLIPGRTFSFYLLKVSVEKCPACE